VIPHSTHFVIMIVPDALKGTHSIKSQAAVVVVEMEFLMQERFVILLLTMPVFLLAMDVAETWLLMAKEVALLVVTVKWTLTNIVMLPVLTAPAIVRVVHLAMFPLLAALIVPSVVTVSLMMKRSVMLPALAVWTIVPAALILRLQTLSVFVLDVVMDTLIGAKFAILFVLAVLTTVPVAVRVSYLRVTNLVIVLLVEMASLMLMRLVIPV